MAASMASAYAGSRETQMAVGEGVGPARLDVLRQGLSRAPLLAGGSAAAVEDLARRARLRSRRAGEVICAQDDPGGALYLLIRGSARAAVFGENGRELTLSEHGAGDFFGEVDLFDVAPRSATVTAMTDAELVEIGRDAVLEHVRRYPQTGLNLLAELSRRLRRAEESVASLALDDVEARLRRTLGRLAVAEGERIEGGGLLLKRRPTQQALANMVGSCRETVSRTFTSLIRRGLLVQRGRALVLTAAFLA